MRRSSSFITALLAYALAAAVTAQEKQPQAAAPPAPLALEEILIEPAAPGPDTLCKVHVKVRNGGRQIASRLAFEVTVNGQALPAYARQLYLQNLPPGEVSEVRLWNFWTTETSRPLPANGKLVVEVVLREASWVDVVTEDGVEVSRPVGAVSGLPVRRSVTVTLRKP